MKALVQSLKNGTNSSMEYSEQIFRSRGVLSPYYIYIYIYITIVHFTYLLKANTVHEVFKYRNGYLYYLDWGLNFGEIAYLLGVGLKRYIDKET